MKKKLLTGGLVLALAVGSVQSASAKFLGCGTEEYAVGNCFAGYQATMVQLYIFGFAVGSPTAGAGQAC